jgi:hypothetical protein
LLTLKALNRKLLAKQYLSRKASGSRAVVKVAEACCGINSQDFLESFESFWARVDGFQDSDLLSELRPKGGLVRTWTVRNTMHIIPVRDYWVHVLGGPGRRFPPLFDRIAKQRGIPNRDFRMRSLYEPFLDHVKGRAVTSKQVSEFMVERLTRLRLKSRMRLSRGWSSTPTYGPSWTGLSEMSHLGLLVNAGRKGSESLWMRSADWLNTKGKVPDSDECVVELVRKYIDCYSPVTRQDIIYWTFLLKSDVDKALEALKKDLTVETLDFSKKEEHFSFEDREMDASEPPRIIILPEFDSLMMGYKDKGRFLSKASVKQVFWGLGGIHRTILVDGFVSATWKRKMRKQTGMIVGVTPLRILTARERKSISDNFASYADYKKTRSTVVFES